MQSRTCRSWYFLYNSRAFPSSAKVIKSVNWDTCYAFIICASTCARFRHYFARVVPSTSQEKLAYLYFQSRRVVNLSISIYQQFSSSIYCEPTVLQNSGLPDPLTCLPPSVSRKVSPRRGTRGTRGTTFWRSRVPGSQDSARQQGAISSVVSVSGYSLCSRLRL